MIEGSVLTEVSSIYHGSCNISLWIRGTAVGIDVGDISGFRNVQGTLDIFFVDNRDYFLRSSSSRMLLYSILSFRRGWWDFPYLFQFSRRLPATDE